MTDSLSAAIREVSTVVDCLEPIVRDPDTQRQEDAALYDLGTLFEVTRTIGATTSSLNEMMREVARTIRERHKYETVAIYLAQPDSDAMSLAGGAGALDMLRSVHTIEERIGIVSWSAIMSQPIVEQDRESWKVAVPISDEDIVRGVLVMVAGNGESGGAQHAVYLGQTLGVQIAVGIENASLHERQIEMAAQEERSRIAREIHDGVAQSIYALVMSIETCATLAERERNPLSNRLRTILSLSRQTLLEARQAIYDLAPTVSGEDSVIHLMQNHTREFQTISGIPVHLTTDGDDFSVPAHIALCLHRILSEALTNILKHASASQVVIELLVESDTIRLRVADDGIGFGHEEFTPGYGVASMTHRVEELGGSFRILGSTGAGVRVIVNLPIQET